MRVFLVDDSQVVRKRLLELSNEVPGLDVVGTAANIAEAAAGLYLYRPDVLVLDIHLGQSTGFDLLKVIAEEMQEMEVVLVTSSPIAPYRSMANKLGVKYLFDKTTDIPLLQKTLCNLAATKAGTADTTT